MLPRRQCAPRFAARDRATPRHAELLAHHSVQAYAAPRHSLCLTTLYCSEVLCAMLLGAAAMAAAVLASAAAGTTVHVVA